MLFRSVNGVQKEIVAAEPAAQGMLGGDQGGLQRHRRAENDPVQTGAVAAPKPAAPVQARPAVQVAAPQVLEIGSVVAWTEIFCSYLADFEYMKELINQPRKTTEKPTVFQWGGLALHHT